MSDASFQIETNRIKLPDITARAFQHPLDRQATDQLKRIKGFDTLVAKFVEYGIERMEYVTNIGSNVRVGPLQMPKLYAMLRECCSILGMSEPELYVQQGEVNAYTSGHTRPYIVMETALLELMEDDEVMFVMAHELGHIKCSHVLYKTMARGITPFLELLGPMALLGSAARAGLLAWDRRSELSADRAGLLVLQDATPCMSALMKLAGGTGRWIDQLNLEQFLKQSRSYRDETDQTLTDRFYQFIVGAKGTHPFTVERAKALDEWIGSIEYKNILLGDYPRNDALAQELNRTNLTEGEYSVTQADQEVKDESLQANQPLASPAKNALTGLQSFIKNKDPRK